MKHIVIDNNNFTILEGTKGVYPISDIVKTLEWIRRDNDILRGINRIVE